jgi:hypothetical protein
MHQDPRSERTTLIGIGFRERDQAFDFKNALNEYVKYVDRMHLAEKLHSHDPNSANEVEENNEEVRRIVISLITNEFSLLYYSSFRPHFHQLHILMNILLH